MHVSQIVLQFLFLASVRCLTTNQDIVEEGVV